jgi:proteasome accessory factor B
VDRIRGLAVNPVKPKSPDFEVPVGFRLSEHVAREAWRIKAHDPVRAVLRFEPPVAGIAVAELGGSVASVQEDGEARVVELEATYLDGLLPTVLWYRDRVKVLSPPELVDKVKAAWQRMGEGA